MCRMIGIATNNGVSPLWFESFLELSRTGNVLKNMTEGHDDGWGVTGYLGNTAVYFGRSDKDAAEDVESFNTACGKAVSSKSRIVVAHLRKASEGARNIYNTHPFMHKDLIFCHNGDVHNSEKLVIPGLKYDGTTDSERLFRFIANRMECGIQRNYHKMIPEIIAEIKQKCGYSSLTFLLSNGERLIGYRDYTEDEDYYTLYCAKTEKSFIFCSEPLPGFEWKALENKELILINKHGLEVNTDVVFANKF